MKTSIPNLFQMDDLRGKKIKLIMRDGNEYICIPQDFFPTDDGVAYTVEIVEGEDKGLDLDIQEDDVKEIVVLS